MGKRSINRAKKGPKRSAFFMDRLEGVSVNDRPSRARQKQSWHHLVDEALLDHDDDGDKPN